MVREALGDTLFEKKKKIVRQNNTPPFQFLAW